MNLNDAVLSGSGATWDNPPTTPPIWSKTCRDQRRQILASYPNDRTVGFKDPRILFTLDGWLEELPETYLVGTFRHPYAVAQSLTERNGFSMRRGLELWLSYNRMLLNVIEKHGVPLINFGWPVDYYKTVLRTICERINLTSPSKGFDFFDSNLRHDAISDQCLQERKLEEVYNALVALSTKPSE